MDQLISTDPFAAMTRPRVVSPPPDPFTADERDRMLGWFFERQRSYHPFLLTLFYTGMRPSEVAALRWGDVDVETGAVAISRSRYLGGEGAPKTAQSYRTIWLLPIVRSQLKSVKPLRADAEQFVFTNARTGGPIHQGERQREFWKRPIRALNIRPRKFYATRHTFISWALTKGANLKWLAEYCGTSVAMIERRYGRFLHVDGQDPMSVLLDAAARGRRSG